MRHLYYSVQEQNQYPIVFLVPAIKKDEIYKYYIEPFGLNQEDILILDLYKDPTKKKTPMKVMREYITQELEPVLKELNPDQVIVCDSDYFKAFTKETKVEANLGYFFDTAYGDFQVTYCPNFQAIFYDPDKVKPKINIAISSLKNKLNNSYNKPGHGIIHFAEYPKTVEEIKNWLLKLLEMDKPLSIDIEAFDLKHYKAGIGTITFCWSKHEGIAFPVDYVEIEGATSAPFGYQSDNQIVKKLLKDFFQVFMNKTMYHNITYDAYVLIYELFMDDLLDTPNLLNGLDVMYKNFDDTKVISYLATNSCSGNKLSLKDQAQEFAGNYAVEEIEDITAIPLEKLLTYNLVDGLSTWFTYEKNQPIMVADEQVDIYQQFKGYLIDITQMQLTGMPLNMEKVLYAKSVLEADKDNAINRIQSSSLVQEFTYKLNEEYVAKKNAKYKKKRITLADANEVFNPNSNTQLANLLYNFLDLPVIERTKAKQPSTGADVLKALKNHTEDSEILKLLDALIDLASVSIILTTFIPHMVNAPMGPDGWHYIFGSFNLGGTVSGRLSSSKINLQNLPSSGNKYAKVIKDCFSAPSGWIFAGLDFDSLEDRISAVTTKDPNKRKVYTDGFDGHCLRAFSYFKEDMPGIINTVESINSIKKIFPDLRQKSKDPTFALTYQGTFITLMKNCGFSEPEAKEIEFRYHELYFVSDEWVQSKLEQATKTGYVVAAFGLKVRTPLLKQVVWNSAKIPYEAQSEGRTAGNALGQSWCLLNSRAGHEFMTKVRTSKFRYDIRPIGQIHDAQYFLIRDRLDALAFTNEHLVKAVQWQEHPDIQDDDVKLGGQLSIFHPSWKTEIEIPNHATQIQIFEVVHSSINKE